jgi:hypothetical protein
MPHQRRLVHPGKPGARSAVHLRGETSDWDRWREAEERTVDEEAALPL